MKTFVTADCHFGHRGVCRFLRDDGSKLRPWDDLEQMNRDMIGLWNATVGEKDLVYVLGDFCINRRYLPIAANLNGRKILVKGNHDVFRIEEYSQYFQDVRACVVLQGVILTHIPVHPSQLTRFGLNVHGHTHAHNVMCERTPAGWGPAKDERYMCVSVEQTEYKPLDLQVVLAKIKHGG